MGLRCQACGLKFTQCECEEFQLPDFDTPTTHATHALQDSPTNPQVIEGNMPVVSYQDVQSLEKGDSSWCLDQLGQKVWPNPAEVWR